MLSRTALSLVRRSAARSFSDAAAASSTVKLNFSLPHETIYDGASVHSVIIPGSAGEYGVTANHVPYVAQLKPGVLQILHEEGAGEPEKYFVAGGYALTHDDSSTVRCYSIYFIIMFLYWNNYCAVSISNAKIYHLLWIFFSGYCVPRGRQTG